MTPILAATIEICPPEQLIRCSGHWSLGGIARLEHALDTLPWPNVTELTFDVSPIASLDTAGAWLLLRTLKQLEALGKNVTLQGQRPEHEALLSVLKAAELQKHFVDSDSKFNWLMRIGKETWWHLEQLIGMIAFFGETVITLIRSITHPSRIRWRPLLYNLQHTGFNALPIVGLLSFLMGVVISFQGASQLQRYGANIFIADLVGLSILRELAPLMTAIIVAGRSGSAFASQIATMKVTEEIDALRTIGISPIELLVLPKVFALVIALPLLTVFADVMGVLGGMVMAKSQLGVNYSDFLARFDEAIKLPALVIGIGKAPVFAAIIAMVGCFQGFQVSNNADSVGRQTTRSVVQAIFLIIVIDAWFSFLFSSLKI